MMLSITLEPHFIVWVNDSHTFTWRDGDGPILGTRVGAYHPLPEHYDTAWWACRVVGGDVWSICQGPTSFIAEERYRWTHPLLAKAGHWVTVEVVPVAIALVSTRHMAVD